MSEEFSRPCPHGGSIVTCEKCLDEYIEAERLITEALPDPEHPSS